MKVHKRYTVDEETLREDPKRYGKRNLPIGIEFYKK